MSCDSEVVWNAMSMFVRYDRKISGRIWESWPQAGVRSAAIMMRAPILDNES